MSNASNNQGRAYEYVFINTLNSAISEKRPSQIIENSSYRAAKNAWDTLSSAEKVLYELSAKSTVETIFALEPNITEDDESILDLFIQLDNEGKKGDVRDIIIQRKMITWEIGLSIKHNHEAVKHSRLSKRLDFGKEWYGVNCSSKYWSDIKPIFDFLDLEKEKGKYFRDLESKEDQVYIPLLNAFKDEIMNQVSVDKSIPGRLIGYLLSKYDFYKVISLDRSRITSIISFNMYGTLNRPSRKSKPSIFVPKMNLPSSLLYIDFKPKSKTTLIMCFDNGWQLSFRIHNAKDLVEPSLKFDIQIDGMPTGVNIKFECKW